MLYSLRTGCSQWRRECVEQELNGKPHPLHTPSFMFAHCLKYLLNILAHIADCDITDCDITDVTSPIVTSLIATSCH